MNKTFEATIYRNYITTQFGKFSPQVDASMRSRYYLWKSYLTDLLPKNHSAKILEIGCGMGHNLYALKRLGYTNCVGFDISKECVEYCIKKKIPVLKCRTLKAVKKYGKYDCIVIYDLIEHFSPEEASKFLKEVKQLLSMNGKILLSNPNGEFPFHLPMVYVDISHKFLYANSSMRQLLGLCGLHITAMRSISSFTLVDDDWKKQLFKQWIFRPFSLISEYGLKLYLFSLGIRLQYPKPQLITVAEVKKKE